jgi:hypothetical protein
MISNKRNNINEEHLLVYLFNLNMINFHKDKLQIYKIFKMII